MRRPPATLTLAPPFGRWNGRAGREDLENKQEHENLAGQMRHVEAVIKMLDPSYSLRAISVKRRQPNPWFKRGTVYLRDVLRAATEPLTAREIAKRVSAAANVINPDKDALADLAGVSASLRNHKGKGVERANEGAPAPWRLKN